jgi:hypothetical protein
VLNVSSREGPIHSIQLFGTGQETKIENLFKFNAVEIMMSFVALGWMVGYWGVELIKFNKDAWLLG